MAASKFRRDAVEGDVKYRLLLKLFKGEKFTGNATLTFNLKAKLKGFHIDIDADKITHLIINAQFISDEDIARNWNGKFLLLDEKYLDAGENTVNIKYESTYRKDGCGFHSLMDKDGLQYLYSTSEPYYANRLFPNFDQPNIKASLELSVIAPSDWNVITNEAGKHEKLDEFEEAEGDH